MKRLLMLMLGVAVALGGMNTAWAAPKKDKAKKKKDPAAAFKKRDTNGDGKVSLKEFTAGKDGKKKARAAKVFKKRDKNKDGSLTLAEFSAKKKPKTTPSPS